MGIYTQLNPRHRETQRDTERETQRDTERETQRETERDTERDRETEREREREHPFLSYSSKKSKFHQQMSIYTQLNPISL